MNPPRFDEAVEDLRLRLPRKALRYSVLFGSAARGEATEDSDLDLLLIVRSARDEERVLRVIRDVELRHHVRIGTLFAGAHLRELERQLLDSILREGKPLLGRLPRVDVRELDLEPVRLVAFDLASLPNARKVKLARELFGYETRRRYDGKTYVRRVRGKLDGWGGRKISRGAVLVPEAASSQLDRLLQSYGAKRILIPMWIQRP
ncbi:MAG: nucleotidyltransferase domain-containing protein [Euryarchaeota archaeon]|nr:nucleotidyltransferase domain-containing protein [Euryarchaeota archaeon]